LARGLPADAGVDAVMSMGVVCIDADADVHEPRGCSPATRYGGCPWWRTWSSSACSPSTIFSSTCRATSPT
jgi:hypothetical protein